WDLSAGDEVLQLPGHDGPANAVAYSSDGRLLASAVGTDHAVLVWDLVTGELCHRFGGHTASVQSIHFSPSGRWLASGGWDNKVRVWDLARGAEERCLDEHDN